MRKGTDAELREELMIVVMSLEKAGRHSLTNLDGWKVALGSQGRTEKGAVK